MQSLPTLVLSHGNLDTMQRFVERLVAKAKGKRQKIKGKWLSAFCLCLLPFAFCLLPCLGPVAPAAPASEVHLAVLVIFDQLRGDYLSRWDELFGKDGFHRLEREGAWFQNCHYSYSNTLTGAGHASLATGTWPAKHGIIGNEWYDRAEGDVV